MSARLSETFFEAVRRARQEKRITQAALAAMVGCTQSAISMFESGRPDALSKETLALIGEVLGLEMESVAIATGARRGVKTWKYCPIGECPSNVPYTVRGRLCFKPTMVRADAGEVTRCRFCGEILEAACPNPECGVEVSDAAFCPQCGTAYVPTIEVDVDGVEEWAEKQRSKIKEIRGLSESVGSRM